MPNSQSVTELESELNNFDPAIRRRALVQLIELDGRGALSQAQPVAAINLHCHTFFSFNAYGHSPTSLAWLAHRSGWQAAGIVDFDVLDAVDEFLAAGDLVGVRSTAGIETRLYVPEYASREINSPGEPGVAYHMGVGFTSSEVPAEVRAILADLRRRAESRNRAMLARINIHLDPVAVDYERDVLPLAPGGNATERHMLVAYMQAAEQQTDDPVRFWAGKLNAGLDQIQPIIHDAPKLQNLMRARLMKRGGAGYVQPGPDSFPSVTEFHRLITACGALPCMAWLDGTSAGEGDGREWIEFWLRAGAVALNIIPDRSWNIADPETKRLKVGKLHEIVALAAEYDLPLHAGTEMNSYGNRLIDDFAAPEMAPLAPAFLDGAHCVYGHTAMQRALGQGYLSAWALAHLPERRERNAFYTRLGYRLPPGPAGLAQLLSLRPDASPQDILARLEG
ncbi:MAG TPA: hypothetical protein VGA61_17930 [Anaerolineae bacterium]